MQHPAAIYESYLLQKVDPVEIQHRLWNRLAIHFEPLSSLHRADQWNMWFKNTSQDTAKVVHRLAEHPDFRLRADYVLPGLPWWPMALLSAPETIDALHGFGHTIVEEVWTSLGRRHPEGAYVLGQEYLRQKGASLFNACYGATALLPFLNLTQQAELAPTTWRSLMKKMLAANSLEVWTSYIEKHPNERMMLGFWRGLHLGKRAVANTAWLIQQYTPREIALFQDYAHLMGITYDLPGEGSSLRPLLGVVMDRTLAFPEFCAKYYDLYINLETAPTSMALTNLEWIP